MDDYFPCSHDGNPAFSKGHGVNNFFFYLCFFILCKKGWIVGIGIGKGIR